VRRYELESRTKISSVDILVAVGQAKVVVEVDGPPHYANNRCVLCAASFEPHSWACCSVILQHFLQAIALAC
jgi:hypothetical protein